METRASKRDLNQVGNKLSGYAIVFNEPATIRERGKTFKEVVKPGSINLNQDLKLLWSHDPSLVLGSTKSNTLNVNLDERGLHFECSMPESFVKEKEMLARGTMDAMSFGFSISKEQWTADGTRELTAIDVMEISVVAFPAYEKTSASLRSKREMLLRIAEAQNI